MFNIFPFKNNLYRGYACNVMSSKTSAYFLQVVLTQFSQFFCTLAALKILTLCSLLNAVQTVYGSTELQKFLILGIDRLEKIN